MELRGLLSEEQRGEGMGEELSGEGLVDKYALLTKREVKTAGYWPSSLLRVFKDRDKVEVDKNAKENNANIQPS